MGIFKKIIYFLSRVAMGWLMFYAGITKILNSGWSAKGYIEGTKTFPSLYGFFLDPNMLPFIDFLNKWGLALIGISLILGAFVRYAAPFGFILMLLYYFPILNFPYAGAGTTSYIVDQHIIYALFFLLLFALDAGKYWGFDYYRERMKRRR